MAEPAWAAFVGVCVFLAFVVVSLSRASASMTADEEDVEADVSAGALFANVAVTHGTIVVLVASAGWLAGIPDAAFGLGEHSLATTLWLGGFAGVLIALGNELLAAVADALGVPYSEALRELLTPDSSGGWLVLLLVVLPLVAFAEELLFRGVLVGVVMAGFGTPAWAVVAFSSLLFGLAHGAQGVGGVAVTTLLGALLGIAFVLTDSLLAVALAHYVVNAGEFVVHEALGRNRGV